VAVVLVLVFLVVPFVELWTVLTMADRIGVWPTIAALVVISVLGGWLMKHQGVAVWRRATGELAAGRMPTRSLVDGAMVLLGGALLLTPGFFSDIFGLVLLLPPTRALLRPLLLGAMVRRAARRGPLQAVVFDTVASPYGRTRTTRAPWGTVIGGTVVDAESSERTPPSAQVVDVEVDGTLPLPRPERPAS
jgi:UPF0716 protein FxsA